MNPRRLVTIAAGTVLATLLGVSIARNLIRGSSAAITPKTWADIRALHAACSEFHTLHARFPVDLEELCHQVDGHDAILRGRDVLQRGRNVLQDPWRRPYVFVQAGQADGSPLIYTLGHDGVAGGEGWDADVSNAGWQP